MNTLFKNLPKNSKVWVYQAPRILTPEEQEIVKNAFSQFLGNWNSHGNELTGHFELLQEVFCVLVADESMHSVSGCSIDASVRVIKAIEEALQLSFLDRTQICLKRPMV